MSHTQLEKAHKKGTNRTNLHTQSPASETGTYLRHIQCRWIFLLVFGKVQGRLGGMLHNRGPHTTRGCLSSHTTVGNRGWHEPTPSQSPFRTLSPRGAIWLHLWHANEHKYLHTVKCLAGLQTTARLSYTKMLVPQQELKKQKIKTLKDAFRVFQIRRECQKPKTHGIFTINQPSFHRWQQWSYLSTILQLWTNQQSHMDSSTDHKS